MAGEKQQPSAARLLLQELAAMPDPGEAVPTANPGPSARVLMDQVSQLPSAGTSPPETSLGQGTGFLSRGLVEGPAMGITGIADAGANLVGGGINKVSELLGLDARVPEANLSQYVDKGVVSAEHALANTLGVNPVPEAPQTDTDANLLSVGRAATAGAVPVTALGARGASLINNTRQAAQSTGGQILDTMGRVTARSPGATAAGEVISGAASVPGAQYGGDLAAETLGEEARPYGQQIGGLAAAASPSVAATGFNRAAAATFGTPASQATHGALTASGIDPSLGLVSNKGGQYIENTTGVIPVSGSLTHAKQRKQFSQAGERLRQTAEDIRPPGAQVTLDPGELGVGVMTAAGARHGQIKEGINILEDQLTTAIGNRTPVPISGTLGAIRDLRRATSSALHGALDNEAQYLLKDAVPMDPGLHSRLNSQIMQTQKQLQRLSDAGPPDPGQQQMLQRTLADLEKQMEDNLGVPYEQARDWRTGVGKRARDADIQGHQMGEIYQAFTTDMIDTATQRGVGREFQDVMAYEHQMYARGADAALTQGGDLKWLDDVRSGKSGSTFDNVVRGGMKNYEQWQMLRQNMQTDEWNTLVGDIVERMGVTTPGQAHLGKDFSPDTFLTNWNKTSDASKDVLLADFPTQRKALDDLAEALVSFKSRGKAANPSGTASTAITAGAGAEAWRSPVKLMSGLAASFGTTQAVLSRWLADAVSSVNPTLAARIVQKLPGEAARAGIRAQDQQAQE